jgi:uncharacterized repeat protein (TIGR01451 family)
VSITSVEVLAPFIDDGPSSIAVAITTSPGSVLQTGGLVLFDVIIENTSAVDVVTLDAVVDDVFGNVSTSCFPALPASVAPGGSVLCSYRQRVAGEASRPVESGVAVSGIDDDGDPVGGQAAVVVEVDAAVDLEVTVTPENPNVSSGDTASWDVVVANRGPSEATGVLLRMRLPGDGEFASTACVIYGDGMAASSCDFDPRNGVARIASIPASHAFAITLSTTVDAVGPLDLSAEVLAVDQADIDSSPRDRRGDDVGAAQILMTVERSAEPFDGGAPLGGPLPLWPLAVAAGLAIAAVAALSRPWRWRFR